VSINFLGGSINQHQNWYTSFISRSNQGNLTITINAALETGTISDTRASDPITLKKNGADQNISFQSPIASAIPLTFSTFTFKTQINQSAKDDLGTMLTQLAALPASSFPVSAGTMGYVSVGKQIADFLFSAQLLQGKASGNFAFTPDTAPAPGIYVVLSADTSSQWGTFVDGLAQTPGGGLTSKAGAVNGITYYVYEIKYQRHLYVDLNAALGKAKSTPWASLFFTALTSAGSGWTLDDHTTVEGNLRKQLDDAQTLLAADPSMTAEEKLTIAQEATTATNAAYTNRYNALVATAMPPPPAGSAGGTTQAPMLQVTTATGHVVPTSPTILSISHDSTEAITETINSLRAKPIGGAVNQ
jgi:hypothetical protein